MSRSKFPGKPAKHTNRKRVNVLPSNGETSCNINTSNVTVETVTENKQNDETKEETKSESLPTNPKKVPKIKRRLTRKLQPTLRNKSKRNLLSKLRSKPGLKIIKITHKETNNIAGKFVLPTRSVNSSRVIKPNKRFLNVDLTESLNKSVKKKVPKRDVEEKPITEPGKARVVLRQARLKLHSQTPRGLEGPFSNNSGSHPGTVTCGVCGAVRFYRFVKQARKFNIYSCESCRKFISKMIKRQSCGKDNSSLSLVCHKGGGLCHVPQNARSRVVRGARCPACWLKLCLRSFQMSMSLKQSLTQLLPKHMQGPDILFNNTLPLLWQTNSLAQAPEFKQRPVRLKNVPKTSQTTVHSDIKRQKLDLKGPRVKHVCRSASIVLGQPLAVFQSEDKKVEVGVEEPDREKLSEKVVEQIKVVPSDKANVKIDSNCSETESSDNDKMVKFLLSDPTVSSVRRDKCYKPDAKMVSERKRNLIDIENGISLDYFEGIDPDDSCQNGFCLISSEQFPMPAICFLCGSGGRESLLYCSVCCEPYHAFCLEQPPQANTFNTRNSIWLCPRCTTCSECNQTERRKINCQKCMQAYHPECFNKKWNSDDRPTVCSKCLRCKSCDAEKIAKFVGNLPLCLTCFKLRKNGNFCPICQHCYDGNECCSQMMECADCKKWIHAKCEKLSEDEYQILSVLPESIEYFCSGCCKDASPQWRKSIELELQASFNQILRLLSKNKTARNILKWSPLNTSTPSNKPITNARKLQFSDDDMDLDNNNYSKPTTLDVNKIYSFEENEKLENKQKVSNTLCIVDIKHKLTLSEYYSVREFTADMEDVIKHTQSEQLLNIYKTIFHSIFPWYKVVDSNTLPAPISPPEHSHHHRPASEEKEIDKLTEVEHTLDDTRICSLCKKIGDCFNHEESRLLYCGQNDWVHANCAIWSSEVYEEIDGSLQNIYSAFARGRLMRCAACKQKGATVGCCFKGCYETYHFLCARKANCKFVHNKTMYCGQHPLDKSLHLLTQPQDFHLHRSVFVELDKRRRKYSDVNKVNFMVGSLCVTHLGKIHSLISDSVDAIIPVGFNCHRLFWSTVDPWKLVPYKISTSIQNLSKDVVYIDKNFTVDHTLPSIFVERTFREISIWQKDIDRKRAEILEEEDDEEPQNGADLLSPELTDAILEELPHDLLDGISVQDILMSYDDAIDFKPDVENVIECFKKSSEHEDENLDGDLRGTGRELRRSKSEIMTQIHKVDPSSKSRGQQRSCSFTLSCKLDSSLSPAMKKRKIVAARENNMFFQLLQVDGNFDDSSSSECNSPTGQPGADPWSLVPITDEPVTCAKCQRTYRTQVSYKRHLDTCEILCTSESDSELTSEHCESQQIASYILPASGMIENSVLMNQDGSHGAPVVLASYESYQNEIINTQTFLSSKSTEMFSMPHCSDMVDQKSLLQTVPVNAVAPISVETQHRDAGQTFTLNHHHHPTLTLSDSISLANNQQTQFCMNQTVPLCVNQPLSLQQVNPLLNQLSINQGSISINQPQLEFQPQSVTIQSVPFSNNVTPILNVAPQNQFSINGKILPNSLMQTMNVPNTQWIKQAAPKTQIITTQKTHQQLKSRSNRASRTIVSKSSYDDNRIMLPSGPQSVIVQHLPSTNFVPTFVDSFQQQSGQNVQYIATIAPHVNTAMQTQSIIQLQSDNNLINLVPNLQPTMYIQQPRVMENQLVIDSNGSLGWAQQPVQPVYYGFETIVQNTVMQSQQFLPTTVPGVLTANSSYSTTTQVFQTSKLEPVLDVSSNSFMLVNPNQLLNPVEGAQQQHFVQEQPQIKPVNILQQETKPPPIVQYSQPPIPSQKPQKPISNNINLPKAPIIQEQKIPTNIVTPTPKPASNQSLSRPMNRVLPMPTNTIKEPKVIVLEEAKKLVLEEATKKPLQLESIIAEAKILVPEKITIDDKINKELEELRKVLPITSITPITKVVQPVVNKPVVLEDLPVIIRKPTTTLPKIMEKENIKNESSLKLVFQKQAQDGTYKISNTFDKLPVQVAPLKPIKSNIQIQPLTEKQNKKLENIIRPTSNIDNIPSKPSKKENEPTSTILYTIETPDGFKYSSTSLPDLWEKLFQAIQNARKRYNLEPLPMYNMNSYEMMGLKTNGLKYLLEQLPGISKCVKYKPSFNFPKRSNESDDDYTASHTYGSIRCSPFDRKSRKGHTYDMFGWLASRHRKPAKITPAVSEQLPRRLAQPNLSQPMTMRFRQLKITSKVSVGVYRSKIHGRGLFCLRDIESAEMVIEYAGEVIRSVLTDKREKLYTSRGIGCYMFRVDDNIVVDATMKGNAARFINHSCDPNCYSKVVEILGHKHIIIFALRKISFGEELTYDYKFPFEEDKIPCTCGTRRCRKFLN